ncbi:MAG: hypothetical protein PVJ27_04605 [Candidatus Brocadiaceae bacterium]
MLRARNRHEARGVSRPVARQGDLLLKVPWNVLIILDACRADHFNQLVPRARTVESLHSITWAWFAGFVAVVRELSEPILYVTANPVVDREMSKHPAAPVHLVSVWQDRWGRHGPLNLPTVHPGDVVAAVTEYVERFGQPRRMVVHFVQPHVPFIGRHSVPYSGWGRDLTDPLSREVRKMPHVKKALAEGLVTFEEIRLCYRDNLELVVEHRERLVEKLGGRIVTTADHGELLGERGLYGHTAGPVHPELRDVPWLEERRGAFSPAELPAEVRDGRLSAGTAEGEQMRAKLEALGYA